MPERDNYSYFNSHAHVERDLRSSTESEVEVNFNSHAHVERDQMKCDIYVLKKISTHTLTWSVTKCGIME